MTTINLPSFGKRDQVWIAAEDKEKVKMWQEASIVEQTGMFVLVKTKKSNKTKNFDLRSDPVFAKNPNQEDCDDMTSLYFINEPCILFNLETRSLNSKPYTFMGNVLVAVNPMKRVKDPRFEKISQNSQIPHPFSVANNAFCQLKFILDTRNGASNDFYNQSIVSSGESGAGKTECCKMILKYLIHSTKTLVKGADEMLLQSNIVTEAFGNAQTLRNNNSSRFGKFMKISLNSKFEISGATVETYLLEKSRVTWFDKGERNFHIFYYFVAAKFNSDSIKFRLIQNQKLTKSDGAKEYEDVVNAMKILNMDIDGIFKTLSGILFLGNVEFSEENLNNNPTAVLKSKDLNEITSNLFNGDAKKCAILQEMMKSETLTVAKQKIKRVFDAQKAASVRDNIIKALYNNLFSNIVSQIKIGQKNSDGDEIFIGILDIFGFETFKKNGFNQLLINYANESLQNTFCKAVFLHEQNLYKREGLLTSVSEAEINRDCINMLNGNRKLKELGLLGVIDDVSLGLEPSDLKMLNTLNRTFLTQEAVKKYGKSFKRPHAKLRQTCFEIKHFANCVSYRVGNFCEMNKDKLPINFADLFEVKSGRKAVTIIKRFQNQIADLTNVLENTQCSFIRCVKPTNDNNVFSFERKIVSAQLRNLSIPQTVKVLQSGFPTRLSYSKLLNLNSSQSFLAKFMKGRKNMDEKKLMKAVLFAFEIDNDAYKLGHTLVFFKSGQLFRVQNMLNISGKDEEERILKRILYYFVRLKWRDVFVKVKCCNRMISLLKDVREKIKAKEREEEMMRKMELEETERIQKKLAELAKQQHLEKEKEKIAMLEAVAAKKKKEEEKENIAINKAKSEKIVVVDENHEATGGNFEQNEDSTQALLRQESLDYLRMVKLEDSLKGFVEGIFSKVSTFFAQVKKDHDERMLMLQRSFKVTNRIMLKLARKMKWFQDAEQNLNKLQETLSREYQKVIADEEHEEELKTRQSKREMLKKKQRKRRKQMKSFSRMQIVNGGRVENVLSMNRVEAQTGLGSALEHLPKVKKLIESGSLAPSALEELLMSMQEQTKEKEKVVEGQFQPRDSKSSTDLEDALSLMSKESKSKMPFPRKHPSHAQIKTQFNEKTLAFDQGKFFVAKKPQLFDGSRNDFGITFIFLCGWEDSKIPEQKFAFWDMSGTLTDFGMLFDSLKKKQKKKIDATSQLPGLNRETYQKLFLGGNKKSVKKLSSRERQKLMMKCLDLDLLEIGTTTKVVSDLMGDWMSQVLNVCGESLLQNEVAMSLLNVDIYGGQENVKVQRKKAKKL